MDNYVLGIAGKAEYIAGPHLVYDFEYVVRGEGMKG